MCIIYYIPAYKILRTYPLSPFFPGEVLKFLKLLKIVEFVIETSHALPCHEANMLPLLPQCSSMRILDLRFISHTGLAVGKIFMINK